MLELGRVKRLTDKPINRKPVKKLKSRFSKNQLKNLKTRFLKKTNKVMPPTLKSRFLSNQAYSTDSICPTLNILEKEPLKYTIPKRKLITLFTKNYQ